MATAASTAETLLGVTLMQGLPELGRCRLVGDEGGSSARRSPPRTEYTGIPEALRDVHSAEELREAVGARVTSRSQLQWWPLSSVELLTLESGARLVYKAQRLLVAEPAFYRAARCRTRRLPKADVLTEDGDGSTMLLEHLGQPVSLAGMQTADVVALARQVAGEIDALPQDLPVYLDISTVGRWVTEAEAVLGRLTKLIETAQFRLVSREDVCFARRLTAFGAHRLRAVREDDGYFVVMADPEGNEFCIG